MNLLRGLLFFAASCGLCACTTEQGCYERLTRLSLGLAPYWEDGQAADTKMARLQGELSEALNECRRLDANTLIPDPTNEHFAARATYTLLDLAVLSGDTDEARFQLSRGIRPSGGIGFESMHLYGDGNTLLLAVRLGHEPTVRLLIESGVSPDVRDDIGRTPLFSVPYSSPKGAAMVDLLLESGASLNARDKNGFTPLSAAVNRHAAPLVSLLLRKGAEQVPMPDGESLIDFARRDRRGNEVLRLLEAATSSRGDEGA